MSSTLALGGYKAHPWNIRAVDSYKSQLSSEGITIAVEPLIHDSLARQVFDKKDMVTRGIMPVAIIIFNDNDFPVMVRAESVELIQESDRIRTRLPEEVVNRLFAKGSNNIWIPNPVPQLPKVGKANAEAYEDFEHKFLGDKIIPSKGKGGGFLFLALPGTVDIREYVSRSTIYVPEIYRYDTGSRMIFFEIELRGAVDQIPRN